MSVKVSQAVWANFREGGNLKLTLLALADWADESGDKIYPSMSTIAAKVCCSEDQARRMVHALIKRGLVAVVGNEHGGAPGSSRKYRINLDPLTAGADATPTPCTGASPTAGADARGINGRRVASMQVDGLHPCGFTPCTGASLSVIEPSFNREGHNTTGKSVTKHKRRRLPRTACPGSVDVTDRMSEWAISEGVPKDRVLPETSKFIDHHLREGSLFSNWDAAWRNWMRKAVEFAQQAPNAGPISRR